MPRESVPKTAQASTELVEQVDSEKTQKVKRLAEAAEKLTEQLEDMLDKQAKLDHILDEQAFLEQAKLDNMLDKYAFLESRLMKQNISASEFKRMLRQ